MNIASLSGILLGIPFKVAIKDGVTVSSTVVARNIVITLVSLISLRGKNPISDFPWSKRNVGVLLTRSISGQCNFAIYNFCLPLLPLGLLTIIHKTQPFWMTIMGYCIMSEPIMRMDVVGCIICFAAFIVIVMTDKEEADEQIESATGLGSHLLGAILAFIASWLNAGAIVANRLLKGIDIFTVCFFHGLIGFTLGVCYMIYEEHQSGDMFCFLRYT